MRNTRHEMIEAMGQDDKATIARLNARVEELEAAQAVNNRILRNASRAVGYLEDAGMGKVEGRGNCLVDMALEAKQQIADLTAKLADRVFERDVACDELDHAEIRATNAEAALHEAREWIGRAGHCYPCTEISNAKDRKICDCGRDRLLSPTPASQPDYCETDDVARHLRAKDAQITEALELLEEWLGGGGRVLEQCETPNGGFVCIIEDVREKLHHATGPTLSAAILAALEATK